jgi:Zn-dependent protease
MPSAASVEESVALSTAIEITMSRWTTTTAIHTVDGPVGDGGVLAIMFQPLYQLLTMLVPIQDNMALHPTAFAAWVGFLVTAINLLPIGQLDGGHIARGLLGEKAKYLGYAAFGILVIMALLYDGWILFALLVFFMGIRHPAPLNDISKLNWRTAAVGILGMVVLVATFVPQPLVAISPDHSFDMGVIGSNNTTVAVGGIAEFHIFFNNTGNTNSQLTLGLQGSNLNYQAYFWSNGATTDTLNEPLPYKSNVTVTVRIYVSSTTYEMQKDIQLMANSNGIAKQLTLTVAVS